MDALCHRRLCQCKLLRESLDQGASTNPVLDSQNGSAAGTSAAASIWPWRTAGRLVSNIATTTSMFRSTRRDARCRRRPPSRRSGTCDVTTDTLSLRVSWKLGRPDRVVAPEVVGASPQTFQGRSGRARCGLCYFSPPGTTASDPGWVTGPAWDASGFCRKVGAAGTTILRRSSAIFARTDHESSLQMGHNSGSITLYILLDRLQLTTFLG